MTTVDLSCDAGDEVLLDFVTAVNVSCGFLPENPGNIRSVCETAVRQGVSIGAQVSYRDHTGIVDDVLYQLGGLDAIAGAAGGEVRYVKPDATLEAHAAEFVDAVWQYDSRLPVLCHPGTRLYRYAHEAGLSTVAEAVPTRRTRSDPDRLARRCVRLAFDGELVTIDGALTRVQARSLCLSGA